MLDLANMDGSSPAAICAAVEKRGQPCVELLTRWGGTSRQALEHLPELLAPAKPAALVVLQDFVVGGAEGREAVNEALRKLDVPVFKALRLSERTATQWRLSPDGFATDKPHRAFKPRRPLRQRWSGRRRKDAENRRLSLNDPGAFTPRNPSLPTNGASAEFRLALPGVQSRSGCSPFDYVPCLCWQFATAVT